MKWAIGIQYDGSNYHGWQSQKTVNSVQSMVEKALGRVCNQEVTTVCAGRTDKGVHALCQVAHFETQQERTARAIILGSNCLLPADVRLVWARPVAQTFHARFCAISRHYQYVIYNAPVNHALFANRVAWFYQPLDEKKMQLAANDLLGEHDFSAFRGPHCQAKTPVRHLERLTVRKIQEDWLLIDIIANAFLHHMVRNIVGVLLPIGYGEKVVGYAKQVLHSLDRKQAGITAPASGLYFVQPNYSSLKDFPASQDVMTCVPFAHLGGSAP